MLTTQQVRDAWGPACEGARTKVALYGHGVVSVRTELVEAVHALNRCFEAHDYPTRAEDTGAYNCRKITGGSGYSLHAYGVALDINWESNPYGPTLVTDMPPAMRDAIKAIRTNNGKQVWRCGADYSGNRDPMHYEAVCTKQDLATGIDPTTVPASPSAPQEDDDMPMLLEPLDVNGKSLGAWLVIGNTRTHLSGPELDQAKDAGHTLRKCGSAYWDVIARTTTVDNDTPDGKRTAIQGLRAVSPQDRKVIDEIHSAVAKG